MLGANHGTAFVFLQRHLPREQRSHRIYHNTASWKCKLELLKHAMQDMDTVALAPRPWSGRGEPSAKTYLRLSWEGAVKVVRTTELPDIKVGLLA